MHSSLYTASMTHGEEREQSRNSPRYLLRAGLEVAGVRRYGLDPASNPDALVNARTEVWYGGVEGAMPVPIEGVPGRLLGDGTVLDWTRTRYRHIFGNPPWGNLEPFFEKAHRTALWHRSSGSDDWSIQMLVPLRPHRVHWRWVYSADAWCLLKPVAFEGFEEKMAIPCVWLYWGSDVARLLRVFHGVHGMVLTSIPEFDILTHMPRTQAPQTQPQTRPNDYVQKNDNALLRMLFELAKGMTTEEIIPLMREAFAGRPVMDLVWFESDVGFPDVGEYATPQEAWEVNSKFMNAAKAVLEESSLAPASGAIAQPKKGAKKTTRKPSAKSAKKRTKKAPAKPSTKSAKKTTKKAAAKKAPKKPPKKPSAQKSSVHVVTMRIGDGVVARAGDTVCRKDAAGKVGVITGFEGKCAKVRWGNARTAVKVIADDLVTTTRETKGTQAAKNDVERAAAAAQESKPSKTERLDNAVITEILQGRETPFTCQEIATAMSVSLATALRSLKRLTEAGKVATTGSGRKSAYKSLVPAMEEQGKAAG